MRVFLSLRVVTGNGEGQAPRCRLMLLILQRSGCPAHDGSVAGGGGMNGPYDVLMVDPPWPVGKVLSRGAGWRQRLNWHNIATPYDVQHWPALWTMLDESIFSQATIHHTLFIWTLEQYLTETEAELATRGYRRTHRLIWDKGDGPFVGVARRTHEYLLWYSKPRLLPIAQNKRGHFPTVIRASQREHSRKPSAAYTMVEALYPDARKLDAFSREYRQGWDAFGDQIDHFSPLFAGLREATS